jgi:uncharacterized RDD family membrane protein YckC
MIWYYAENNSQAGPVSDEQLRELVTAGRIQAATLVWKAGMDAWTPLSQAVPGLAVASVPAQSAAAPAVMTDTAVVRQKPFGQLGPETALCSSCGQFKPLDELVMIAGQRICAQCKPLALQKLQQGETATRLNYAGFWIRFAATLMDGIILMPVLLLSYFFIIPKLAAASVGGDATGLQIVVQIGYFLFQAAYKIFFPGRFGATPGQMVAGLKIVREDGSPINYRIATLRFLAEIVSALILYIGYLMIAFDDQKRALHDRLVNTRVIRK